MNLHQDWGVIIGLIGGCQEINTGEAGLSGWILVLKIHLLADLLFKLFKYSRQWLKNKSEAASIIVY